MPFSLISFGFGDDLGGVQQGLGRDAADVEADSA
jgi:hypothetical protein